MWLLNMSSWVEYGKTYEFNLVLIHLFLYSSWMCMVWKARKRHLGCCAHVRTHTEHGKCVGHGNTRVPTIFFFKWTTRWRHGWKTACTKIKNKKKLKCTTYHVNLFSLLPLIPISSPANLLLLPLMLIADLIFLLLLLQRWFLLLLL